MKQWFAFVHKSNAVINNQKYVQIELGVLTNYAKEYFANNQNEYSDIIEFYSYDGEVLDLTNIEAANIINLHISKKTAIFSHVKKISLFLESVIMYYSAIEKVISKGYCVLNMPPYKYTDELQDKIRTYFIGVFKEIQINLIEYNNKLYIHDITVYDLNAWYNNKCYTMQHILSQSLT